MHDFITTLSFSPGRPPETRRDPELLRGVMRSFGEDDATGNFRSSPRLPARPGQGRPRHKKSRVRPRP